MKHINTKDARRFFNSATDQAMLIIDVFDEIGASMFCEGITAGMISDALAEGKDCSSVTLNINSPGGDLFEGVAAFNVIKACGKPVNVNIIGLCASAASLIACAGDKVTMCPGSTYMIHEAQAVCMGYSSDMKKMADVLDTVTASAADLYTAKTGQKKEDILKLMAAETWMSPEEAVAGKFADAIGAGDKSITNVFDLAKFKNTPEALRNAVKVEQVDEEVVVEVEKSAEVVDYSLQMKRVELERKRF
jgi:ATP-dependent protease ClpP protease subunit